MVEKTFEWEYEVPKNSLEESIGGGKIEVVTDKGVKVYNYSDFITFCAENLIGYSFYNDEVRFYHNQKGGIN